MSAEENRALARRWFEEVLNKGNASAIDALTTEDFVLHHPARPGQPVVTRQVIRFSGAFDVPLSVGLCGVDQA